MTFITTVTAAGAPANVSAVYGALITPALIAGFGFAGFGVMSNKRFGMLILQFDVCIVLNPSFL